MFSNVSAEFDDDNEEEENEYDEVEEEDEDEDEEDEGASGRKKGPKRKKRRKGNHLVDLEAEEDDADDEDDEDEFGDPELVADDEEVDAAVDRERREMIAQRLERKQALENDDPHALARYFSERYEGDADDYETGAPDTSGIDQQSLLPTIRDPRLWVVRCKPGYERKAIFSLLQKMFNMQKKGIELGIFAAVAPEHPKGHIYVEAVSAGQVGRAVDGLGLFSARNVKQLPLEEMPEVLKTGKRPDKLMNGNWVRIKGRDTIYRGDLAQVCNVREGSNDSKVTIRVIPRLDLKGEKEFLEDVDKDEIFSDKATGTKRKGRPPQKLFDRKELFRLTGSTDVHTERSRDTGEVFDVWNNEMYRFGLMYIPNTNVKNLERGEDVQPTVEELEQWIMAEKHMRMMYQEDLSSKNADIIARGLQLDISSVAGRRMTKLFKGDSVRVTHGEQKGLEGSIVSIDGDVVLVNIAEFPEPVRINREHLSKNFKIGEHVKVASGKKAGYAGAIVRVEGDFLTIFTDSTREEIKVLSSQVADSADVNGGVESKKASIARSMRYELFDLVQMLSDPSEKGVVIQVQNESLTLLTPQNTRRTVPVGAVKGKIKDTSVRALDMRNNPIAPNDTIHVMNGPLQNRQGVVKHVAGNTVFFKARDEVNNCGLLAVVANFCTASTAAARTLTSTLNGSSFGSKLLNPAPRGPGISMGRGMGRGGVYRGQDSLLRKEVRLKSGPYKGYNGTVVDVVGNNIKVQLASKPKTITVPREKVKDLSDPSSTLNVARQSSIGRGLSRGSDLGGAGRGLYTQTPRVPAFGTQTPRADFRGLQTPRQAATTPRAGFGFTPMHLGNSTPGRDDFHPAATPFRDSSAFSSLNAFNPPKSPASEGNPYAMGFGPQTPSVQAPLGVPTTPMTTAYGPIEPNTPAPSIAEPTTPGGYALEPNTPAPALEPHTPAPVMEPQTPAPGNEPHTPGPGMEPNTPMMQEPATPHTPGGIPQTFHPQEEDLSSALGYRVLIDVQVLVKGQNNFAGKVLDAAKDGSYIIVRMLSGSSRGEDVRVDISEITPVQPRPEVGQHEELVKVLDGAYANRIGLLLSVAHKDGDDMEGRIKFKDDGTVANLNMSFVAKCCE